MLVGVIGQAIVRAVRLVGTVEVWRRKGLCCGGCPSSLSDLDLHSKFHIRMRPVVGSDVRMD